jgi:hypothetical protein
MDVVFQLLHGSSVFIFDALSLLGSSDLALWGLLGDESAGRMVGLTDSWIS